MLELLVVAALEPLLAPLLEPLPGIATTVEPVDEGRQCLNHCLNHFSPKLS